MNNRSNPAPLIIMYHYVRNVGKQNHPGVHAITPEQFEEQIEKLKKEYVIISLDDVRAVADNLAALPTNACVLTFDDGLKDHYEAVFPVLKKNNISGAFFPITMSLGGRVADAHKLHFLMSEIGAHKLAAEFNGFLATKPESVRNKFFISNKEKIDPRYRYDDTVTANLKVTTQILPKDLIERFFGKIFSEIFGDEAEFASRLYLSPAEIREMADNGMVIGSHTHTHPRLNELSKNEARRELLHSKQILEGVIKEKIFAASYPFGCYNEATIEVLAELGYDLGLGTAAQKNEEYFNKYTLKRANPNYFL